MENIQQQNSSPLRELAQKVAEMREAQNQYYSSRSSSALTIANAREEKVDKLVAEVLAGCKQVELFQ